MYRYNFTTAEIQSENTTFVEPKTSEASDLLFEDQLNSIREDVIGNYKDVVIDELNLIKSPIDQKYRKILYADYAASGRSLRSIESFISDRVLPWYGNTHSVASGTARQSTYFREEARHVIRNYFNCTEDNAVIFTGSGVTAAVAKLVALISGNRDLFERNFSANDQSHLIEDRWGSLMCKLCNVRLRNEHEYRSHCFTPIHCSNKLPNAASASRRALVFYIDAHNHHSAMLPFRELAARNSDMQVVELELDALDIALAQTDPSEEIPVCIMCAMSNINGKGPNFEKICALNEKIHAVGGIACWDLASFAAHNRFDMNPPLRQSAFTDFAFVSTHKLIGGPGATGLLLARREWLRNSVPSVPGGGVVFFASAAEQSYIQNSEHREEAGTPDIVGCIRAGLVFALHASLDWPAIRDRETELSNRLTNLLTVVPNLVLIDSDTIVSFNIESGHNLFLHYNFVVSLLNDLFGIQARGGCACAGPFAQSLLGLSPAVTHELHRCLQMSGQEIFRPGFVRISLHWTMTIEQIDAIGAAVAWIAQNGPAILPYYTADLASGEWKRHRDDDRQRIWLTDFRKQKPKGMVTPVQDLIAAADLALEQLGSLPTVVEAPLHKEFTHLVWFAMPGGHSGNQRIIHPTVQTVNHCPEVVPAEGRLDTVKVPRKLRALTSSALIDYHMIKPGDRVLIGLSGGKDSLSLLHILIACQKRCPFRFEIAAATVDPQVAEYQPGALVPYLASLGITYHYLSQPIMEIAKTAMSGKQSICAFCSRMKRGMLYTCMRKHGYNVLALGQHLDDLVESFLMSCFRNGSLRTMKANYFVTEKDLRVIRPLIYVREKMTEEFAKQAKLPIIRDNCPACFAAPKERHRIKLLLSKEEFQNNQLFASMLQCMKPLIGITSALSTKDLINERLFPIQNCDEEDDQAAEETLLPCSDGTCAITNKGTIDN